MDIKNNSNIGNSAAEVIIQKSTNKNKKFMANVNGKLIHFGAAGYEDYLQHNNEKRRERYIKRHQPSTTSRVDIGNKSCRHEKRENWNDPTTAGFWSRWLLWNKETIDESMRDINKRFNLNVKME